MTRELGAGHAPHVDGNSVSMYGRFVLYSPIILAALCRSSGVLAILALAQDAALVARVQLGI